MLNVRFSTVRVIAFVSTAVKLPWNDSVAGAARCFFTGGVGVAAGGVAAAGGITGAVACMVWWCLARETTRARREWPRRIR